MSLSCCADNSSFGYLRSHYSCTWQLVAILSNILWHFKSHSVRSTKRHQLFVALRRCICVVRTSSPSASSSSSSSSPSSSFSLPACAIMTHNDIIAKSRTILGLQYTGILINIGAEWRIDASVNLSSLVQIMTWRLVDAKPISEPMLESCWFINS